MDTTVTLATILAAITSLVNGAISWMESIIWVITDKPLLLAFVLISFVGLGVTLIKRIISM